MAPDQEICRALAVFSNYENIRNGTLSRVGLKYPDEFTSQVFSKKERHRLEERARRSRLALALQELETTVAETQTSAASQPRPISTAETVNAAISLIKELRGKVHELEEQRRPKELGPGQESRVWQA